MLQSSIWAIFGMLCLNESWALPSEFSLQSNADQQKQSAAVLIDQAYAAKQITIGQWTLFQCYALFDQQNSFIQIILKGQV